MTKKDRTTLKSYFRDGALPTASHYKDLINSCINQVEDGYDKTPQEGLILKSVGSSTRLLSLYEGLSAGRPSWVIDHGQNTSSLHFKTGGDDAATLPGISFSPQGYLGVQTDDPAYHLDVNGTQRARGRIGFASDNIPSVDADGKWKDITGEITGCQAFEVMAGVGGKKKTGRYSMLRATALNAYQPRNQLLKWLLGSRRIRTQTATFGTFRDRIQLRWKAGKAQYHFKLQIRTNAKFKTDDGKYYQIRYYLTQLWFDPFMDESRVGPGEKDGPA